MTAIQTASDCFPVRPLHILYEWFRHLAQKIEGVSKLFSRQSFIFGAYSLSGVLFGLLVAFHQTGTNYGVGVSQCVHSIKYLFSVLQFQLMDKSESTATWILHKVLITHCPGVMYLFIQ